jgi:hypothetical protein
MTPLQVRDQFERCGYEVSRATTPTRYIAVKDQGGPAARDGDYRVAMSIVYASRDAAAAAHRQAHREAEERIGERWPFSDDNGPQLLSAYGGSVWRGNVALVQSSFRTLTSLYSVDDQTGEARLARPELLQLGFVTGYRAQGVDRDFVDCLEAAAGVEANDPVPSAPPAPVFVPGQPW